MASKEFCLDDFVLDIYCDAYLVKVETHHPIQKSTDRLADLPDWVFNSRNAIWLTDEEAPLPVRAEHGEAIKKRLNARARATKS